MTVTGQLLWWLGGLFAGLAVPGFARHKGLGVLLLLISALLTFWAWTGTSLNVQVPQVHPSSSPGR